MKSKNKFVTAVFSLFMLINSSALLAAENGDSIDKVMKFMLVLTVLIIAVLMWLIIVYSEKNDNEGLIFKTPLKFLFKWFTKSTPIEKEAEILLHHDYDGIRELDNRIPPWFHFLFYGTIAWAVVYMLVFHVFNDGQIQEKEYNSEIQQAAIERQILIKSGVFINEETVEYVNDAATISEGKEIYVKNCLTCHGQNGEGTVGPNLTDDFWIHGGGIKNIFKTVKYGVPAKGMISWQTQLDPKKMQAVSSYIITMHGTNPPNAKAPEGDKWEEVKTDSVKSI
jgi:cytochrome c oxidase cbb3-type subunit 3